MLADRASQWLVLAAIVIGLLTFAVWYLWAGQPLLFAMTVTITVFVIACPDALGLATPMVVMVGTGLGAMNATDTALSGCASAALAGLSQLEGVAAREAALDGHRDQKVCTTKAIFSLWSRSLPQELLR